jgi:SNF2 family DNA or RNA helicase
MPTTIYDLSYAVNPRLGEQDARLRPYQKAAVEQAVLGERKHVLLGHHPGKGKSAMALCIAKQVKLATQSVIIICPPSLKLQWARQCAVWADGLSVGIYDSNASAAKWQEANTDISIIPDSVVHSAPRLAGSIVIVDEVHRHKANKARRTLGVFGGWKFGPVEGMATGADRIIALTGTPIVASPADIYPLLHCTGFTDASTFNEFCKKYCPPYDKFIGNHSVVCYDRPANLPMLNYKLRSSVLIRPRLEDYETQVPLLTFDQFDVQVVDPAKHYSADEINNAMARGGIEESTSIAKMRREVGVAKAKQCIGAIADMIEGGERPVVWCWHREVTEIIAASLGVKPIHGGVATADRAALVAAFVAGETNALVASISAMGTGTDGIQHATDFCIFVEESFTPAENEQAVARLDRMGQTKPVRVTRVISNSMIDAAVRRANDRKTHMSQETLK